MEGSVTFIFLAGHRVAPGPVSQDFLASVILVPGGHSGPPAPHLTAVDEPI